MMCAASHWRGSAANGYQGAGPARGPEAAGRSNVMSCSAGTAALLATGTILSIQRYRRRHGPGRLVSGHKGEQPLLDKGIGAACEIANQARPLFVKFLIQHGCRIDEDPAGDHHPKLVFQCCVGLVWTRD